MLGNLKDLLLKFKNIQNPKEVRKGIADEMNLFLGSELVKFDDIETKNHIIYLKIHPGIRQKIHNQKHQIIKKINDKNPDLYIKDIL